MNESPRYVTFKNGVEDVNRFGEPMDDVKYNPPHRPPAFSPYDAVLPLYGDEWEEERVKELLDENEVRYDRVVGVGEVDDPRLDGDALAYISLKEYAPS